MEKITIQYELNCCQSCWWNLHFDMVIWTSRCMIYSPIISNNPIYPRCSRMNRMNVDGSTPSPKICRHFLGISTAAFMWPRLRRAQLRSAASSSGHFSAALWCHAQYAGADRTQILIRFENGFHQGQMVIYPTKRMDLRKFKQYNSDSTRIWLGFDEDNWWIYSRSMTLLTGKIHETHLKIGSFHDDFT